ncbi:MAG: YfcE family phosphodiesterase [Clostridia bacterium]|nr:YfcE family phosphodiesterase [Clostridia bacterium]
MKVLVTSDSHGFTDRLLAAVQAEADCQTVVFLGDGLGDLLAVQKKMPGRKFIAVRGNNDWEPQFASFDDTAYQYIGGQTVLATHGHLDGVRFSLAALARRTAAVRGTLALFGHTHRPTKQVVPGTGVLAVNPGALCSGQYAVLEITPGNTEVTFKTLW